MKKKHKFTSKRTESIVNRFPTKSRDSKNSWIVGNQNERFVWYVLNEIFSIVGYTHSKKLNFALKEDINVEMAILNKPIKPWY